MSNFKSINTLITISVFKLEKMIAFSRYHDKRARRELFGKSVAYKGRLAAKVEEDFVVRVYLTLVDDRLSRIAKFYAAEFLFEFKIIVHKFIIAYFCKKFNIFADFSIYISKIV